MLLTSTFTLLHDHRSGSAVIWPILVGQADNNPAVCKMKIERVRMSAKRPHLIGFYLALQPRHHAAHHKQAATTFATSSDACLRPASQSQMSKPQGSGVAMQAGTC